MNHVWCLRSQRTSLYAYIELHAQGVFWNCIPVYWMTGELPINVHHSPPTHTTHKTKLVWYTETKNKPTHLQEGNNYLLLPHPTLSESSLRVYSCITGEVLFKQTDSVNKRSSQSVPSFAFPDDHALPGI